MASDHEPEIFHDGVLVTIDAPPDPNAPRGLDYLDRCVEKQVAGDTDPARIATVREAVKRLMSRTSPPERNHEDYYLVVRYLLRGRLD